ncbi:MAG: glycosyltransferase family 2 protein [Alphaproteobacteria bacterium]|nr:glycosyltransferase family 2 protein [Alphaproteobacteria bacterium]
MASTLQRLDSHLIENSTPECRAIIIARNEAQRLPWLLSYYRKLGISRFFVVDNGSTDGSLEFLAQQKDCHVFSTSESFATAKYGVLWHEHILQQYGEGSHWWLILDADEMLIYPGCESVLLPEFCTYLEGTGAEGLYTAMIDMYNRGPVAEAVYKQGQPFLEVCPYLDTEYKFRPRLKAPFAKKPFPRIEPVGGPRLRRFYPEYHRAGMWAVAKTKILRRLRDLLSRFGIQLSVNCSVPPILFKVPLFQVKPGFQLVNSHMVSPLKLASVTGALLHFKFFSDFHERVMGEVKRGEHFDGASEYARYLKAMESDPRMSFFYGKSVMYRNSGDLVRLGLIKDDTAFAAYRSDLTGQARKQA